ncbi:hypothetical protein [Clostridium ganghwense]|uniref:Sigma-70 family RNA polymerase sigma factor n=1 Tax=Clostridium ganghwense TaxID=312089 RepID=A0ABT4CY23_9CLOT|nr:hypothetical protein [Clostridium ganghwense]MCY6372794.1 hypothetical protein [Clostridium ganghwense]
MNSLIKNFLNRDEENQSLYIRFKFYNDENALYELEKKLKLYMFQLKFCSYIGKSMNFYSKHYQEKKLKKDYKEMLNLNIKDKDFGEERINMISDKKVDFIEEVSQPEKEVDFKKVIENYKLLNALEKLPARQKEIIYKLIVLQKKEKQLIKELGISRQAINKSKRSALNKLRNELNELNLIM